MVASPSQRPAPDHPLLQDRVRLNAILDAMYIRIQKVLHPGGTPAGRAGAVAGRGVERGLAGGVSADDVLQDAAIALLRYPSSRVTSTWEAVAIGIARHKAQDALRRATKGRGGDGDDEGDRITLVSLGSIDVDADDQHLDAGELEREYAESRQQQILLRLARELLNDRERRIFFDIHYFGISGAEVGRALGLTGQRVGQIYRRAAERLLNAAHNDPEFRRLSDFAEDGGSDD